MHTRKLFRMLVLAVLAGATVVVRRANLKAE